jgi:hypothetical protein
MLAARQLLQAQNPGLLAWSDRQWKTWLSAQRDVRLRKRGRQLIVMASVTGVDDLMLHIGVMQLLTMREFHCRLFLCLPTDQSVHLTRARARREEWEMLVDIIEVTAFDEVLRSVSTGASLAAFPVPNRFSSEELEVLAAFSCAESCDDVSIPSQTFVGPAGAYLEWTKESDRRGAFQSAIGPILATDPVEQPSFDDVASDLEAVHGCSNGRVAQIAASQGQLEIAQLGDQSEVLVAIRPPNSEPVTVLRQAPALTKQPLLVRPSASCLTTEPQVLQVLVQETGGTTAKSNFSMHVPPAKLKPWMLAAFLNRGGAGNPVIRAFANGVGCRLAYAEDEPDTLRDVAVVWGVLRGSDRILAQAKAQNLYFFYVDHAYFNRGHGNAYRITRNGYEAGPVRRFPGDRINGIGPEVLPWRKSGRDIIVCPPTEYFMRAHDCSDWLPKTLETLSTLTDRPVVVRDKPKAGETAVPLRQALETAHALVTHSSNVAIEAACLGTPVFVAPTSAAAPVGRTDLSKIEKPIYPDRAPWLAHLAYNQFSFDEIADGRAWQMLLELEERDFA